ncbi:MAG: HPr(Ser) kinase/phosphatase [Verrucomicrobiae bacterium]|nr:HPr(Ser) kinase/phosphatase [Verrucomicrobiae bacterium]
MKARQVTVRQFYEKRSPDFRLQLLTRPAGLDRVIREPTVNRPGLVLAGFTKYFPHNRIQVIGNVEMHYLRSLGEAERHAREELLLSHKIPAVVFCRRYSPSSWFIKRAEELQIPVFRSPMVTMRFINKATLLLEELFAPTGTVLGSMVDILGVGVIIKGESGIGKSECVLALIERGYSLVADDVTKVRLFEGRELIGTCPETTRNHMEVRGIGIINVPAMFGIRSIRAEKRVDLVVTLRPWRKVDEVDRTGIETETEKILGVEVPHIVIPVRPGRDIARLVEVAALQTKLKQSGYNPAEEFNRRLIAKMTAAAEMPSGD